jgi:crossover junction endodeoxyribonuclease RuvC
VIVAGIDPSLRRTGVCVADHEYSPYDDPKTALFGSDSRGKSVRARMDRAEDLVGRICGHLEANPPELILLEGYSYGSEGSTVALAEFGGLLRYNLLDLIGPSGRLLEVAPGTLKKFATGKGNSPKDQMAAHVAKHYAHLFPNNDHVDAFCLWNLACCCADEDYCNNATELECVWKVIGKDGMEDPDEAVDKRLSALFSK